LPWGSSSAIFQPFGHGKGSSDFALYPTGVPAERSGGKSLSLMKESKKSTRFLEEETSFYFSAGTAAGDSWAR
jgi:hypothetical protein